jgi:2-polyprenyl-3-methyl-5-hydroxy-6-metoxy-1,4-benzoquinol methylase
MPSNNPVSPVTELTTSKLFDRIPAQDIIELYNDEFSMNVTDYFKGKSFVDVFQCVDSGYKFFYPFSLAGDEQFYQDLQTIHKRLLIPYYRKWGYDHQYAFENINNNDVVLDVGCGSGIFLEKAKTVTQHVFGLEFNEMAIHSCERKGISVSKELVQEHAQKRIETYDMVCAFQVLEHVYEVKNFIESMLIVLKKGGRLIIGVPNNDPYFQRFNKYVPLNLPPHHMGLWNKQAFINLQKFFPLKFIEAKYDNSSRLHLDAYFHAKKIMNVKSTIHKHTMAEKLKMFAVAPYTLISSIGKHLQSGIPHGYIVVKFEKV